MRVFIIDVLITAIHSPENAQNALKAWVKDPGEVFRI